MPFLMIRNDITKVAADAIVNPANRNLLQGSGTSRAIYQAAGEQELTAACEAIGHCDLGRAVCTPAFGLPAKYIFHAVCPAWHGGFFGEAKQLAGAYHSALELAAEYHCESVAFPLLSSGNYGYPKEQAFRIAVDTITQYVMEHDLTVYLVLYDRDSLAVSRKLFASVEEYIDDHYVAQNDESYGFGRRRRELSERRRLLEEDAAVPMLGAVPAPAAAPRTARSLESLMDNLGESFTTRLLRLIDERGLKDSTVYKQSNISRQHFSKIQCNRDYNPKKKTVLAFAVGLHLSEDETIDLLKSAGYAFSDGSKRDWIVREKERYGWEFLFLGANMDAVKEAARFGISSDRAVRFENDAQGVAVNYHVVSETVSRMREAPCCASIGAEWKEQIEADFQKRHQG